MKPTLGRIVIYNTTKAECEEMDLNPLNSKEFEDKWKDFSLITEDEFRAIMANRIHG